MIIDTHCHLSRDDYSNIDQIVKRMGDNIMIISGVNDKTNKEVMEYVKKYTNVYGVVGIHPSEVEEVTENTYEDINKYLKHPKIVGIGEIGLDYHYDKIDVEKQKEVFIKQILLANKTNKAIVIHSRDAYADTYDILKEYKKGTTKIIMHCYSYSKDCALELKKIGCKFGIGGVVTFKNAKKMIDVVNCLDINDILLETDSPYLAPEPLRGQQNSPDNIRYIAEKVAEIKNISVIEVETATTKTAIFEFDLSDKIC